MENILLIRLKAIGDIIFTLPAVNVVRDNFPRAKITFLVSKENSALLRGFREVDEVISLDRATLRGGNPLEVVPEFFGLLRRLRAGKFSHVVDFQGFGETAWLARFTGAPQRWGSVYSTGRKWAYTQGIHRDNKMQLADWNLSLLEQCGLKLGRIRNEFFLPPEAQAEARRFLEQNQLQPAKPTVLIFAFTSTPGKNWPLENFLALAEDCRNAGRQVIFSGGPKDQGPLQPARDRGFVTATDLSLLASAGLVGLATVTVGGNTGMLHLAVAMQKRVVMLIGHPAQEYGFPYQHHDWAVVPESGGNISEIPTAAVMAACARAMEKSG